MSEISYDGKWGSEIRRQSQRDRKALEVAARLARLRSVAVKAQELFPGPWQVSEANFIVRDCIDGDPETGKAVAEVDCCDEYVTEKTAFISAFDPDTCLELIDVALNRISQRSYQC